MSRFEWRNKCKNTSEDSEGSDNERSNASENDTFSPSWEREGNNPREGGNEDSSTHAVSSSSSSAPFPRSPFPQNVNYDTKKIFNDYELNTKLENNIKIKESDENQVIKVEIKEIAHKLFPELQDQLTRRWTVMHNEISTQTTNKMETRMETEVETRVTIKDNVNSSFPSVKSVRFDNMKIGLIFSKVGI